MSLLKISGGVALLAIFLALGTSSAPAGMLDWIRIPGVCYDYDPHDVYQQYGKYYPYSGERCRKRRISKQVSEAEDSGKGRVCKRTNIRNHSDCRG